MTSQEWDTSTDPDQMLAAAADQLTDRQLLLFGAGAARHVWDKLPMTAQEAVVLAEAAADLNDPADRDAAVRVAARALGGTFVGLTLGAMIGLFGPHQLVSWLVRQSMGLLRVLEGQSYHLAGGAWLELVARVVSGVS